MISVIITYLPIDEETRKMTQTCIDKVKSNTHNEFEIVLSTNKENIGVPLLWDLGARRAIGDILVFMNNDVFVEKDWDVEMVNRLQEPGIGVTFPYSILGTDDDRSRVYRARKDGFCFAVKRETYDAAGSFLQDQPFRLGYYEDDYFFYRVQYLLGMKLVACSNSKVFHKGKGTSSKLWSPEFEAGVRANEAWYNEKTNKIYPYLDEK